MIRIASARGASGLWRANQIARALGGNAQIISCEDAREAVLSGAADVAVHAAEELPCPEHDRLQVVATPARSDPCDVLCAASAFGKLPSGASVGAAGARRMLQISELRPDLRVVPIDRDVAACVQRVGRDLDAVVVSLHSLAQLGLAEQIRDTFSLEQLVPAAGQASLAVEAHGDDRATIAALAGLDHADSRLCLLTERAVLRQLPAWPASSIGVISVMKFGSVSITGVLAAGGEHRPLLRARRSGPAKSAELVANAVASALLLQESLDGHRGHEERR